MNKELCIRVGKLKNSSIHVYTFYHSWILFPYKLYKWTNESCWNRRVFRTVTGSSGETRVSAEGGGTADTQAMKI